MHFSAKRGLAIACRPSVRPSVCDVGDLWSHRLEILESNCTGNYSPTPSLFPAKRRSTYYQGTWGNFGETRGGVGKIAFWRTKAAISLKRVKMKENLLWRAYKNSPTLFRTVLSLQCWERSLIKWFQIKIKITPKKVIWNQNQNHLYKKIKIRIKKITRT